MARVKGNLRRVEGFGVRNAIPIQKISPKAKNYFEIYIEVVGMIKCRFMD